MYMDIYIYRYSVRDLIYAHKEIYPVPAKSISVSRRVERCKASTHTNMNLYVHVDLERSTYAVGALIYFRYRYPHSSAALRKGAIRRRKEAIEE